MEPKKTAAYVVPIAHCGSILRKFAVNNALFLRKSCISALFVVPLPMIYTTTSQETRN